MLLARIELAIQQYCEDFLQRTRLMASHICDKLLTDATEVVHLLAVLQIAARLAYQSAGAERQTLSWRFMIRLCSRRFLLRWLSIKCPCRSVTTKIGHTTRVVGITIVAEASLRQYVCLAESVS